MIYIGEGYDVHAFSDEAASAVVLGGIAVPYTRCLSGHSDADVLTHAIMDALLGAAKIEDAADIGELFPPTNPHFAGISSLVLLKKVAGLLVKEKCTILNIDATLVAQEPKIAPYKKQMVSALAEVLSLAQSQLSVKATTTEHLGFIGRGEGIAARAVCLLERSSGQTKDKAH